MNLLIVSHTPHYRSGDTLTAWGPTVREIDTLARLFNQVVHVAPLHTGEPPGSALPYTAANIRLHPVSPSGGEHLRDKVGILHHSPGYLAAIRAESKAADVIHVRAPANISLQAILLLALVPEPAYRWVKYAGNWRPTNWRPTNWRPGGDEPTSYRLQRTLLQKNVHRGVVTVNGCWENQPAHIHTFTNPCLSEEDRCAALATSHNKQLSSPYRMLYAGRLEVSKGVGRFLEIARMLQDRGIPFHADLVGDGPQRQAFETQAHALGIAGKVTFHGWLARPHLAPLYEGAHFLVFPSASEGWPKVLSEAMAYGVVPVAGAVSSIPQVLGETGAGVSCPPMDHAAFARAIMRFVGDPPAWQAASRAGLAAAARFTYESYVIAVQQMFLAAWGIRLAPGEG